MAKNFKQMKGIATIIPVVIIILFAVKGDKNVDYVKKLDAIVDGITMVAPPKPFSDKALEDFKASEADWVAFVPYGFTQVGSSDVVFDLEWQWWGERSEGIEESIKRAHNAELKVMLKPQVYMHGSWVGNMDFEDESDWLNWEKGYRQYIMNFAQIAAHQDVEMFCIGTEYVKAVKKREKFWRDLIKEVRSIYSGQLVYSSNWDAYQYVPFWDALDYIGISSYFPLTDQVTPTVAELKKVWKPVEKKIRKFSRRQGKPVLFTEYGYLTVDGCAYQSWELEKKINDLNTNQTAQANAIDALLSTFYEADYWAGGFLWKWFPDGMGHEGYVDKDYTPQGKKSLDVLRKWYGLGSSD